MQSVHTVTDAVRCNTGEAVDQGESIMLDAEQGSAAKAELPGVEEDVTGSTRGTGPNLLKAVPPLSEERCSVPNSAILLGWAVRCAKLLPWWRSSGLQADHLPECALLHPKCCCLPLLP